MVMAWWWHGDGSGVVVVVGYFKEDREIVKKEYLNKMAKTNRVWDVRCNVKLYGIINKVTFKMVKWNTL